MRGLALLAAVVVLAACETVTITGRSQVVLFSDEEVAGLADKQHLQFVADAKQKGVLVSASDPTNGKDVATVERVARRIIDAVGLTDKLKWEELLIRDPQANAFVLPNGKVVVYTGLLPIAKSDAGLAAVLGHEVGHVVARHSAERLSQSMLAQTGVQAANAAVAAYDPRFETVTAAALGLGAQYGVLMPYNRQQESEADHLGIIFMAKAGYDPAEAIALWERMGESRTPQFLSTHPSSATRRAQLQEWLPEARRYYENRSLPLPLR